ncbi:MAG: ABC transporter ATP-binding protein/permease [Pirellulales bacterium]|nr:ABC transporter ATP-binding protein/permease [Pirellulales bacterium]
MDNFARALRLAIRRRWLLAASMVCALMVGVLWGGNIGTVYPIVDVVLKGQSLHNWIDGKIATSQQAVAHEQAALAAPGANRQLVAPRLAREQLKLARYETAAPYVKHYTPADPFSTLVVILAVALAGLLVKNVFFVAQSVLVDRITQTAIHDLRKAFFRRTLRMDLATFTREGTSDLMARFTADLESLAAGMSQLFGKAVREPLKMVVCLAGAAFICWRLLLFSLIIAPVAAILIRRLSKHLKRANRRAMEEMSQIYGILDESLQGIKVVKAFTMERHERRRFHLASKSFYARSMRIAWYDALTHPLTESMGMLTIFLAMLAGAYLVIGQRTHLLGIRMTNQPLDLVSMMMFYAMLAGTSDPARKLSDIFNRLQRASAAADRVYALLDREPEVRDPAHPRRIGRHHREIAFENVSFSYGGDHLALDRIDLRIPFGQTVAIVGPNGCGKTTLANLIPRFFDPTAGIVRLDGHDLREVRQQDLRCQLGLVTQETLLFDDTVANNIQYGSPHASRAQIIEAARQAHAHRFIEEQLANGYDTVVGPKGGRLSGGQRQRIALARAILRDPAILILDEATSQIDTESERLIQRVLEQFVRNRTTIIITHRPATLALAQRVLVMDRGRIVAQGSHDELLACSDFYGRLHQLEFRESA